MFRREGRRQMLKSENRLRVDDNAVKIVRAMLRPDLRSATRSTE